MIVAVVDGILTGQKPLGDFHILEVKKPEDILGRSIMAILQVAPDDDHKLIVNAITRINARFLNHMVPAGCIGVVQ